MYGLLIEAVIDFAKRKYGNATWEKVKKKAKIESYSFSTHQQYSETLFNKIIKSLVEVTNDDLNELMEELGVDFVNFVGKFGYDKILRVLGRHMRDFLNGLDNLHEYMRFSYSKLKPPSFFVENESATGLILHYRSKRKGFRYYVRGQIRQVGKVFYNLDVKIDVLSENQENDLTHVIFKLNFKNDQYNQAISTSNLSTSSRSALVNTNLNVKSETFFDLFPFHLVFKRNMEIISIGEGLSQAMKHVEGESIKDLFNLVRPLINFTWDNVISHTNNVFELTTIEPVRRSDFGISNEKSKLGHQSSFDKPTFDECLRLKGQMMLIKEWDAIIFLATPVLENLENMFNTGFYINDLSMHDSSRDLVLVGTQQSAELKLALDQEKQKSVALEDSMKKLDQEMKKTDQLLYQMLPKKIADRIRSGEPVMNLVEVFPSCTILFSDVVGFTSTCSQLTPMEVVSMLNAMYTKFDKSLETHNVYKVETIGDAYMVVSGLPERINNHPVEIVEMAFDMLNGISTLINPADNQPLRIRVGCHSGPVVAGVVGLKMPRYCLFGDTVNTASKMESSSEAMKIHISEATKLLIENKRYKLTERGKMEIKGKGEILTYFVACKIDEYGREMKSPFMEVMENLKNNPPPPPPPKNTNNNNNNNNIIVNSEVKKEELKTNNEIKTPEKNMIQNSKRSLSSSRKELKHQDSIKEPLDHLNTHRDSFSFTVSQMKDSSPNNLLNDINKSNNHDIPDTTNIKPISNDTQNINNAPEDNQNTNQNNGNTNLSSTSNHTNVYSIDIVNPPSAIIKQKDFENHNGNENSMHNITTQEISFELNRSSSNHESNGNVSSSQSTQNKMLEMPKRSSFLSITCNLL